MNKSHLTARRCPACEDVLWSVEDGENCWVCGAPGVPAARPVIGSQLGWANAMSEIQWAEVRRQIL